MSAIGKQHLSAILIALSFALIATKDDGANGYSAMDDISQSALIQLIPATQSRSADAGAAASALAASGWEKLQAGKVDAAKADFDEAIAANSRDAHALSGRATINARTRQYNQALADANAALYIDPSNFSARFARGSINFDINRYSSAIEDMRAVLAANDSFVPAHIVLADALVFSGDRTGGVAEYRKASVMVTQTQPPLAKQLNMLARMYQPSARNAGGELARAFEPSAAGASSDVAGDGRSIVVENLAKVYQLLPPPPDNGTKAFFLETVKWDKGHTLTVAFNGGDDALRKFIADTASEWSKYANVKFDFTDSSTGKFREWTTSDTTYAADVRIAFNQDGYWSVLGKQSLEEPAKKQTMNLDPAQWQNPNIGFSGTVLHEFGHALGFMHEHQHPGSACSTEFRWDDDSGYQPTVDNTGVFMADSKGRQPGLLTYYVSTQGWIPLKTYSQLATYETSPDYCLGEVDRTSIMQYPMDSFLLKTGKASPCYAERNNVLSQGDKDMAKKEYPFE